MPIRAVDLVADHLNAAAQGAEFQETFGKNAASFVVQLPALFHLFRRASFDLALPAPARHLAAAAALYIAEPADFLGDDAPPKGLVDDVWVAYAALAKLVDQIGEKSLVPHWRGGADVAYVVGLARNVSSIAGHVPHHVLDRVQRYLGG